MQSKHKQTNCKHSRRKSYGLQLSHYHYTKYHIYTIWYNFVIVLYRFLETGTSDRRLIGIV